MSHLRPNVSSLKSRFTTTQRILIVTLSSVFVLSGVALSSSAALRAKLGLANARQAEQAEIAPQPQMRKNVRVGKDLLRFADIEKRERAESPEAPVAPTVTATKTDSLFADADNDNQADPGDTIKYTVNISASGQDATGVTFTDNVDPNTTFVPGSLTATPVAVNDSYSALGNVRISVAAPGVLGNDFTGLPAATITAPPVTSANGGNVTLNADGSFTYNPPPGFEGTDTFTYTLTNAQGSNNATVSINVSGMIWFIDNNATCPCDGRLTNPFNTIASFQAVNNGTGNNPAANDNIFIYESASSYSGSLILLNGQKLIGQDATASLSSITGLTPPPESDPLPVTNSANATIVLIQSGGTSITVGQNNTLRGFTGGSSTTDISGTGFGTLTISDVTLNGVGQALDLTTGTLAATFGSISSANSTTTGISLSGVAGSLTTPTTTITNPNGIGISVGSSSATLNFGNTNSSSSGGTGVSLLTNTGTITFGSLDISPDANQRGLLATDNSLTLTSTSGTISASGAVAVEITRASGTTPLAISLTSVSDTAAVNGIVLSNTSGSFTVTGNSSGICGGSVTNTTTPGTIATVTAPNVGDCTGGTIQTSTGAGIKLNNTSNVSLTRMRVTAGGDDGISGTTVNGFALNAVNISNNGNANGEQGMDFTNLLGAVSVTNSSVTGSYQHNFSINNTSGTMSSLLIDGSNLSQATIPVSPAGGNGFVMTTQNAAIVTMALIKNSVFRNNFSNGVLVNSQNTSTIGTGGGNFTVQNSSFDDNNIAVQCSQSNTSNFICRLVTSTVINDNRRSPFGANSTSSAVVIGTSGAAATGGTLKSRIDGNVIGSSAFAGSGSSSGNGVRAIVQGLAASTITITNNTIRECPDGMGMDIESLGAVSGTPPVSDLTVTNNNVNHINLGFDPGVSDFTLPAIYISGDNQGTAGVFRTDVTGNTVPAACDGFFLGFCLEMFEYTSPTGDLRLVDTPPPSVDATAQLVSTNTGSAGASSGVQLIAGPINTTARGIKLPPSPGREQVAHHSRALGAFAADQIEDVLMATEGEASDNQNTVRLTQAQLQSMIPAAIERWRLSGISDDDYLKLQGVSFEISDLPEGQLATANGTTIKIDETAAGYSWYVDPSATDDDEFDVAVPGRELQTTELSPAFGRMDLLTVVMRELGCVYKQSKTEIPDPLRQLMESALSPAVRRLPDSRNIQLRTQARAGTNQPGKANILLASAGKESAPALTVAATSPVSGINQNESRRTSTFRNHAVRTRTSAPMSFADVLLNIGTLPAGKSVTITFNATVNNPFTSATPSVSNQGTVSGSNFANVLTDDPDVGGTVDPTVTPIDLPKVSVAVSPASVLEDGATNLTYTFTRTGSTTNAQTINFNVGGTATFGTDYTQSGAATLTASSGTVTFAAGSATAIVTIDPSADTTVEPDETVSLTVTSGVGYTVGSPSSATGTITNDDTDVSVAVSPASVAEDGATNLTYTFTRVGVTSSSLTVNFNVGGTAGFGSDYSQSGAASFTPTTGTVTFSAGSLTAIVTVDPTADSTVEPDETVDLTLTAGTGYNVASPSSASGTILNDDTDVSVAVSPASVAEDGATNLTYTFTRVGVTSGSLTVNFSVGGTAGFGSDYSQSGAASFTPTTGTVTFSPGSSTAIVTIDPTADSTVEPDETVDLTVTAGAGYNVASPSSASGTIVNDDTDVSVAVSPASVSEDGATNLTYTFTRAGVTSGSLTVNFSVGGTASFGSDYSQSGAASFTASTGTVTFSPGNSTAVVTIDPTADSTVEPDETVDLTVTAGTGYNVGSPASASGTITNDDTDVSVAVSPASVAEDGATNLVYTFTRNGVTATPLTVNFSVGGTAGFGTDYSQSGATTFTASSGTVTFGAGNSTATVTVDPTADNTVEPDETVSLTLSAGSGYNVSSPSSATGTITNDDSDVSVTVSPAAVAEDGATNLVYTFTRSGFTTGAQTVTFSVGGTATFGVSPNDYTVSGATTFTTTTGSVTFAAGSSTAQITVDPEADTTVEPDETVIITLNSGAGFNAVSPDSATGTILNDDTLVSVVVSPTTTAEGGAPLVYTFTRTGPTTAALTINVSVGGTASFPADYTESGATTFAPPNATVTFGAGSATATVTVTPLTDCEVEGNETVDLAVQAGTGYAVGSPSSASGTITNTPDSTPPTITLIPNVNMVLWPPNHQYVDVSVTDFVASASDSCDASVNLNSVYILSITSDEAENGNGDGNTLNDIVIGATCKTAQLRAERDGGADGRVYTITFKVKDSFGNFSTATVQVTVPKNPNTPAVDSGVHYTVNSLCP